jgi:hypothetical protein
VENLSQEHNQSSEGNTTAKKKAKKAPAKKAAPKKNDSAKTQKPKEKYYRVMFLDKSSPNDPDDVELSVNAETLVIQRGVVVVIPERFKVCADNAKFQHFKQVPGKPRKLRGTIKIFPFQLLGEATEAEFLAMKSKGNKQTRDFIKKFGFDGNPDDV